MTVSRATLTQGEGCISELAAAFWHPAEVLFSGYTWDPCKSDVGDLTDDILTTWEHGTLFACNPHAGLSKSLRCDALGAWAGNSTSLCWSAWSKGGDGAISIHL